MTLFIIISVIVLLVIIWALIREIKKRKAAIRIRSISNKPIEVKEKPAWVSKKTYATEIDSFLIIEHNAPEVFECMARDPVVIIRDNRRLPPGKRTEIISDVRIHSNIWFTRKGYKNVFAPPPPGYHKEYQVLDRDFAYKYVKNV